MFDRNNLDLWKNAKALKYFFFLIRGSIELRSTVNYKRGTSEVLIFTLDASVEFDINALSLFGRCVDSNHKHFILLTRKMLIIIIVSI